MHMQAYTDLSHITLSLRTQSVIYLCFFIYSGSQSSRDKFTPLLKLHREQPFMFDLEWRMSWTWSFDIVVGTFLWLDKISAAN